jgi:hypothetical protein
MDVKKGQPGPANLLIFDLDRENSIDLPDTYKGGNNSTDLIFHFEVPTVHYNSFLIYFYAG